MKDFSYGASQLRGAANFLAFSGVMFLGDLMGYSLYSAFILRLRFITIRNIIVIIRRKTSSLKVASATTSCHT
jgi:hypothetical protein